MPSPLVVASVCVLAHLSIAQATDRPPAARAPGAALWQRGGLPDGVAAHAQLLDKIAQWRRQHPALVHSVDIGTSVEGRPLSVLRIGDAADGAPELYVGACIHGGEGSESDAVWMIDGLLDLADDVEIRELLHTRVLWVQPVINPDGLVARQRKNAHGVDLNRNFAARWQPHEHSDRVDYPGTHAFSEPEACALRDFLASRVELRAYLDLHRSADVLISAQSGEAGSVDDVIARAGASLHDATARYSRLRDGRLMHFPEMRGLSIDWVWAELGVVAFTMENDPGVASAAYDPRRPALRHLLERVDSYPRARTARAAVGYSLLVDFASPSDTHIDPGASFRSLVVAPNLGAVVSLLIASPRSAPPQRSCNVLELGALTAAIALPRGFPAEMLPPRATAILASRMALTAEATPTSVVVR